MFRYVWILCAAVLAGALSAYTLGARGVRADFAYVNPSGIHTLDPARMSWTPDFRVALNIWEGLTALHPQTLIPTEGAAYFPPAVSEDGLTYRFSIRTDARWSNGDPVTAHDFIRGWRRAMEPGTAADYAFFFTEHVAGADAYAVWRRNGAALLTALTRLAQGWTVSGSQARAMLTHPFFNRMPELRDQLLAAHAAARDPESQVLWEDVADRLSRSGRAWAGLYQRALHQHVSQLDKRWVEVGVSAPDDRTLVVQLVRPCPYFLDLLALPVFYPVHQSIELLRERSEKTPITAQGLTVYDPQWTKPDYRKHGYPGLITNGAYRLSDWTFKRRARLTVNPFYRRAEKIDCSVVDMLVFDNINAALMAYEAGDLDFLPSMAVSYDHEIARLAQSGKRPDFRLCQVSATYFLNFNCISASIDGRPNPFLDPRVRKAFALAIDKERIVHNVLGRGDRVARSLVPPEAIPGYRPPEGVGHDAGQARRLLAESGFFQDKTVPPVELLCTSRDERPMQALARMWLDTLGVAVQIRSLESKTFAEAKADHRFMVARSNWYADYNDPTTFLDCLTTGNGNNDSGYANPRYDALISKANRTRDLVERAELLRQAEAIIVEQDFPIAPILHYAEPIAVAPHVRGLYPNARLWFPFQYVKVER